MSGQMSEQDARSQPDSRRSSGSHRAPAPAAACHTDSADDSSTLTTRCLLQYCAQYPQHKHYVCSVLRKDGYNLELLQGTPFCGDRQCVQAAVASCGAALQFAAPQLKSDRQIVLAAVENDPFALAFGSDELRSDAGVVLSALQKDPAALALADHDSLGRDAEFMLAAIKLDATAATYAAPALLASAEFRAAAMAANKFAAHWFVSTEHFHGLQDPAVQHEFASQHGVVPEQS